MTVLELEMQNATKDQFKKFVEYLYSRCDKFLMAIPNFERTRYQQDEMNEKYKKYLNNIKPICDSIEPYIIYKYYTKHYMHTKSSIIRDARLVKFYEGFKDILLKSGGFHKWLYPKYPEDLCFFKGQKCWFFTIVHEDMFYIVEPTDEDIDMIEKIGIEYQDIYYCDFENLEWYLGN